MRHSTTRKAAAGIIAALVVAKLALLGFLCYLLYVVVMHFAG